MKVFATAWMVAMTWGSQKQQLKNSIWKPHSGATKDSGTQWEVLWHITRLRTSGLDQDGELKGCACTPAFPGTQATAASVRIRTTLYTAVVQVNIQPKSSSTHFRFR
jgi:hypothetical protein